MEGCEEVATLGVTYNGTLLDRYLDPSGLLNWITEKMDWGYICEEVATLSVICHGALLDRDHHFNEHCTRLSL